MPFARPQREISLPQMLGGALAAMTLGLASRRWILVPLLGPIDGKDVSTILIFFLLGYLAFPSTRRGEPPLPLRSRRRLVWGLLHAALIGSLVVLPSWL